MKEHIDESFFRDFFNKSKENIEDFQANKFAMELLMPENRFREVLKKEKNIGVIADIFGVPAMAVKMRAIGLGYKFIKE